MYLLTFSFIVLFAWILCEIVVIKKQTDKIYQNHVLFEISMPMWSICAQYCSRVQACKSINFIALNKTCQINYGEPGECNDELIESVGNSFAAASTFPKNLAGPCKGHDCKPNEVCMPKGTAYKCFPWFTPQFHENNFQRIFVACSGNHQSILDTWKYASLGLNIDFGKSCSNRHLRSTMIDKWDGSLIDQVKVELFRNGEPTVEINFDGRGSTSSDWFTKNRLRSNSFIDMNQQSVFNIFSMDGDDTWGARHFFISNTYYNGGCPNDIAWMAVIDTSDSNVRACNYDRLPGKAYPYILYGPDQQLTKFEGSYAVADMMIISISMV
ncbi:uncharacterized protein LOC143076301 [Mytilus galloprovincialis]|uniref:uncharacterized protein LOC143076301 n=1 Tax=Mytilus galloprovincialis TaxID=29158 RepID=UPI003F7CBA29